MVSSKIVRVLEELDLHWGHEQDATAGQTTGEVVDKILAELDAETAGVMTGGLRLQQFLEGLVPQEVLELQALLYLGRGDATAWDEAIDLAKNAGANALISKCLSSPRSAEYLREGLRRKNS